MQQGQVGSSRYAGCLAFSATRHASTQRAYQRACLAKGLPCQVLVDPDQGPVAPGGVGPQAKAG
jgi:hypothetical protein